MRKYYLVFLYLSIILILISSLSLAGEMIGGEDLSYVISKAEAGDAYYQAILGEYYRRKKQDYGRALKWLKLAADAGDPLALYNLGIIYQRGLEVAQNTEKAEHLFKKSVQDMTVLAENGDCRAQLDLGVMCEFGYGVDKDLLKAVKWYRKAAEQGYPIAQYNLANFYSKGEGVEKDQGKAFQWYHKAAVQGFAPGQYLLGECYYYGSGVEKDYVKAIKWYKKAALQDSVEAQFSLGYMYENGQGVEINNQTAFEWYRKAAEQEHVKAQEYLGDMFYEGQGVDKDYNRAVMWYKKALEFYEERFNSDKETGSEGSLFNINYTLGLIYQTWEEYEAALKYYNKSLHIVRESDREMDELVSMLNNEIGLICYKMGQYDNAMQHYLKALKIDKKTGNEESIARDYTNIGVIYSDWAQYDKALTYYEKALEIDRRLEREASIATDYNNIGTVYIDWSKYDRALAYFEKALVINIQLELEANIAIVYNNMGLVYSDLGQYDEALNYFKKALEIDKRLGRENLAASRLVNIGSIHSNRGQYKKALDHYEKALKIALRLGREKEIPGIYQSFGNVYLNRGQCEKALKYYEKALRIVKELNREGEVSSIYNGIGLVYLYWGQTEKALEYFEDALVIDNRLRLKGKIATDYSYIGDVYFEWSRYEKALEYYERALEINKNLGKNGNFAANYDNIGSIYLIWGQYNKALEYYQKAFQIAKSLNKEGEISNYYSSLGNVYMRWGDYEKALDYFTKALEMVKKTGQKGAIGDCNNDIGIIYSYLGQYDKALQYFEKALTADMSLGIKVGLNYYYANIGLVYDNQGNFEKAIEYYGKSQKILKGSNRLRDIALNYINTGVAYRKSGQYGVALDYYNKALDIVNKLGLKSIIALCYSNIGYVYTDQKRYSKAARNLLKSIETIEEIRAKAPTDELKRTYLQSQIEIYQKLISVYIRSNQPDKAFNIMELSKAKVLAEKLAGKRLDLSIPYLQEVQQELSSDEGLLIYANTDWSCDTANSQRDKMVELVVTSDNKKGIEASKKEFKERIYKKYGREINEMVKRRDRIREIRNFNDKLEGNLLPEKQRDEEFENIIYFYRKRLTTGKNTEFIARELYKLLIKPFEDEIKDKKELIIVPDGILNFIPFETLIDEEGNYLVEKYKISYIQSETVSKMIKEREYPQDRKELLAFGGAVYNGKSYEEEIIANENQLAYLQQQVDRVLEERGSVNEFYGRLGYGNWSNLPGTLTEVIEISEILGNGEVAIGEEVREEVVKQLSKQGDLANYKVLHFATHGIVVPEVPELSAVVLSQLNQDGDESRGQATGGQKIQGRAGNSAVENSQDSGKVEDGYLRMGEIVDLDIKADFVNLSACETGLGKIYAGEGVVGLTQSFLLAGANSLSVSLWSVADESTARFMVALYQLVQEEGLSYTEAIREVKLMFINGEFGEQYRNPYYWAPFVYYGS